METIVYQTTKEQCQSQIDGQMPIVCSCCGGKLEPIETVDNLDNPTFWRGCFGCSKFDSGTKPEIYKIAVAMVDERHFRAYSFDDRPDEKEDEIMFDYWRKSQIGGTVRVVEDILRLQKQFSINH